jgi:mycothiol system anti-sigma-R factor
MIDCREAVRRMWPFLDHSLELDPTKELETHLATCKRCCGELEFSREMRGLVATTTDPAMPDDLRERIEQLLATGRNGGPDR